MKYKKEIFNVSKNESINILKILLLSVFIGFLFYKFAFNYGGISVFIFVGTLTLGFLLVNGVKNKNYTGIFFIIISILLSLSYAIYSNGLFRFLNKVLIPITLLSGFLLITYNNIEFKCKSFKRILITRIFIAIPNIKNIHKLSYLFINKSENQNNKKKAYEIILGVFIAIPILFILIKLLSSADEVFSHYVYNIIFNIRYINIGDTAKKLLSSVVFALFIFGLYCSFLVKLKQNDNKVKNKVNFNPVVVITMLTLITLLYSIFTKIQISYLYIKKSMPEGFSYSEYARNGFFQLVFIVVVNIILVVLIKSHTTDINEKENKILLILYSLITILTFSMDISAFYKIRLYIIVFGFTRLRILVSIFIVFLALILFLLLMFIWKNINLFKPIIICGAILYVAVNFVNIDNIITVNNIRIAKNLGKIDYDYLTELSFDNYGSMTKAYKNGLISKYIYKQWIANNKKVQKHWYQYNYYYNKGNSIKK